jgi:hypothetical protein
VFLNDRFGQLLGSGQALGNSVSKGVDLGDLDGDGDLDAFVANGGPTGSPNRVWINDGSGHFVSSGQAIGMEQTQDAELGDLDGDGDLDAFAVSSLGGAPPDRVWFNDGSGIFVDSGQMLGSSGGSDVALGDLNNDGRIDAFVANWGNQPNDIWLNIGGGAFARFHQLIGANTSSHVALGDVDDDGDLDAVIANFSNQPNQVWDNTTRDAARVEVSFTRPLIARDVGARGAIPQQREHLLHQVDSDLVVPEEYRIVSRTEEVGTILVGCMKEHARFANRRNSTDEVSRIHRHLATDEIFADWNR